MKDTRLKKWGWRIFVFIWSIFAVIGVLVFGGFVYLLFDDAGYCVSEGHGVWDYEQKICRKDCIKWDWERGCVKEEDLYDEEKGGRQVFFWGEWLLFLRGK